MRQTFVRAAAVSAVALFGTTIPLAQNRTLPDRLPSPTRTREAATCWDRSRISLPAIKFN